MNKIRVGILIAIFLAVWGVSAFIAKDSEQTGPFVDVPPTEEETNYIVLLDPGHGGKDHGAESVSGFNEKDLNLDIAFKIVTLLENDEKIEVVLTRDNDVFYTPEYRYQMANRLDTDVFISIHHNAYADLPSVSGVETFYYRDDSAKLAEELHYKLLDATQFNDRGIMVNNFKVVKYTKMPAVLLEIGYLTNPQQEQYLLNLENQDIIAEAIAEGIKDYFASISDEE